MNFSAWSIRNPVAPILAFFVLVVLGWQSFNSLPITRFPNIDVPIVSIAVTQSGAAPAELETQVTKEIEDAVAGVTGVDHIESTITDGISTTAVIFRMEVPTTQAVQDVKDAIDRIRSDLPTSIEEPIVSKVDVEGQAIQTFSVSSPGMTLEELSWFVDDTIKRAIQGQTGIGRVDRYGGSDREVRVELDEDRLNSFGISAADVNAQLRRMNMDLGSGRGQVGGSEQAIRTLGDTRDVTALADTMIALPNGRFVRLSELGKVIDTYEEPKSFARFNGQPGVTFAVFRAKGASEVSVAETVAKTLDDIRAKHPDVSIEMVDDSVYFTYGNYEAAIHTLIEGAVLAVIVVMLFLRNWRATLISAVALPLSAIPTFWVMELLGFSLNLVSFLAMTLATGILVDDAIVEIENIERHIRMGKSPYRAAIEAADEIGLAVIATTFTIIAVFVPVSFMPGIPGQYFIQFGLTVAVSVFFSLLVARLITPVMAAYLMKPSDASGHDDDEGFMMRQYTRLVRFTTKRWYTRYSTLLAAILLSVGSVIALLVFVPGSFLPPEDSSRVSLSIELPPDAMLADTDRTTTEIYNRIKDVEGVENVFVLGGASPKGDLELRRAAVTVLLRKLDHSLINKVVNDVIGRTPLIGEYLPKLPPAGRIIPQSAIEREIFARLRSIPDVRVTKLNDRGERDLSFNLLSNNEADLDKAVATLEADLRRDPLLANVSPEGALPRPELQIRPRDEQMSRLGITTAQISEVIRIATIGDIDAQLTKIALDGRLIPIRVQLNRDFRTDLAAIRNLKVQTASGATVPLSSVADINYGGGAEFHQALRPLPRRQARRRPPRRRRSGHGISPLPTDRCRRGTPRNGPIPRKRRCRGAGGNAGELRQRHAARPDDGAGRTHPLVQGCYPALHDPVLAAARHRRRGGSPDPDAERAFDAGSDRHSDADGHCHQERDPARRLRNRDDASRHGSDACDDRGGPKAGASDRHDLDRNVRGHAPLGTRRRRRRFLPCANGDRRHRRHHRLDGPEPCRRALLLPDHGRPVAAPRLDLRPLHRQEGRGGAAA